MGKALSTPTRPADSGARAVSPAVRPAGPAGERPVPHWKSYRVPKPERAAQLRQTIGDYFRANRDDELLVRDFVPKFSVHLETVRPVLIGMLADRLLKVEVRGQGHYYVAGPAL